MIPPTHPVPPLHQPGAAGDHQQKVEQAHAGCVQRLHSGGSGERVHNCGAWTGGQARGCEGSWLREMHGFHNPWCGRLRWGDATAGAEHEAVLGCPLCPPKPRCKAGGAPEQAAAEPSRQAQSSAAPSCGRHSRAAARALGWSSDTGPVGGGAAAADEKACATGQRAQRDARMIHANAAPRAEDRGEEPQVAERPVLRPTWLL